MVRGVHRAGASLAHLYHAASQRGWSFGEHLPEFVVFLASVVTVASLWISTARYARAELHRLETQVMKAGADLAVGLSEEIGRTLDEAGQAAAFIVRTYRRDGASLDLSYWAALHRMDAFPAVSVLDEEGRVVSVSTSGDAFDYAAQAFYKLRRTGDDGNFLIGDPVRDAVTGQWRVPTFTELSRSDGSFGGFVVVWLSPERFGNVYREATLKADDAMTVLGTDGVVRLHFGPVSDGLHDLREVLASTARSGEFIQRSGFGQAGAVRIIAHRPITGYPLQAVVSLDYEGAFAAFYTRRVRYYQAAVAVSGVILLLAGALLFMLGKQRRTAEILQQTLAEEALHDALTGLANRALFYDHCERAANRASRHDYCVAVLYLDLDDFKPINDRHGHTVGDLVLQEVASRLQACVRAASEDLVARLGGDEFCVILSNVTRSQCERIARKILSSIAAPIHLAGQRFDLTVSIGAAFFPDEADDVEALIDLADRGMYEAKRTGKNLFRWGRHRQYAAPRMCSRS